MKKLILSLILVSPLIFSGCAPKKVEIDNKIFCKELILLEPIEPLKIGVCSSIKLFEQTRDAKNAQILFYENQIKEYNKACRELLNGKVQ